MCYSNLLNGLIHPSFMFSLAEIPSRGGKLAKNQQRTPKMVFFSYDIKNELESAKLWLVKPAGGKNSSQIWFYFRAL